MGRASSQACRLHGPVGGPVQVRHPQEDHGAGLSDPREHRRPVERPRRRLRRHGLEAAEPHVRHPVMKTDVLLIPMSARWAEMRAAAVAVEQSGFDGLWTWDHLRDPDGVSDTGVPEALTVLAALAEVTRRIALGPLVLNVANRHPGLLANMAATIQQISGGRLLLGLGAGGHRRMPYAAEQTMLGLDVARDAVRAERVGEAAEVLRRLWRGDGTRFAGAHYTL